MDIVYDKEPFLVFVRALSEQLARGSSTARDEVTVPARKRERSLSSDESQYAAHLVVKSEELLLDEASHGDPAEPVVPPGTADQVRQPKQAMLNEESDEEDEEPLMVTVPLQRPTGAITPADRIAATLRNPFTCELLSKSSVKGFYESRYADVSLAALGCVPMFENGDTSARALKASIGKHCVFLRLGTSLVITGTIIAATENMCQVSPDRGQSVSVEWVDAVRVHLVPTNLSDVRRLAREQIVSILSEAAT